MAKRQLIITFHGIGTPRGGTSASERAVWVGRDVFEAMLDEVTQRDDVAITFDDGNSSDIAIAAPELVRRGLTAKFFVVAGRLGDEGFLSADDVRELRGAGMTVGSHGLHHRSWRSVADAELENDLRRARAQLEDALGSPVAEAACPFGEYDRRVLSLLRRTEHERVYTSDGGRSNSARWLQARNTVSNDWASLVDCPAARDGARGALLRTAKRTVKRWR